MKPIDYASAGVNISAGNEAVDRIKPLAASTHSPAVLGGLGGFGSLFDLGEVLRGLQRPVLVQSVDGVGTKVSLARMLDSWESIGWDVVSAVCNDIIVTGARPLTFLDYIANDRLDPRIVERLVSGMAENCREHGISLVGGETAEMPGVYREGEHDVVGSGLGVVDYDQLVTGEAVEEGDCLIGLKSSGLHTNGYSLARKLVFEAGAMKLSDVLGPETEETLGEALLARHINYQKAVEALRSAAISIHAMAHITGGGLVENLPRVLPPHLDARIERGAWEIPLIFRLLCRLGQLSSAEAYRTFNMGIGFVFVLPESCLQAALTTLNSWSAGSPVLLGRMVPGKGGVVGLEEADSQ